MHTSMKRQYILLSPSSPGLPITTLLAQEVYTMKSFHRLLTGSIIVVSMNLQ